MSILSMHCNHGEAVRLVAFIFLRSSVTPTRILLRISEAVTSSTAFFFPTGSEYRVSFLITRSSVFSFIIGADSNLFACNSENIHC